MGLATSAVNLYGADLQNKEITQAEKSSDAFGTVFKSLYQGGMESMDSIFKEASSIYGVSENLLKAVAKAESNFNPKAVSKAGAIGVMQLMPATARALGVTDPYDARQNIMGGAKYLKENLERFGGNVNLALAAYNAGPNSVQKYGGIPPYKETQNYVKTVTSYMNGAPISSGKTVARNALADMYSTASSIFSPSGSSSYSQSAGLYSLMSGSVGMGSYLGSTSGAITSLLGSAVMASDGETITMDKESFMSLMEIMRMQMLMNASREAGSITI